jgi:uncharacterized membrane protein YvbJ
MLALCPKCGKGYPRDSIFCPTCGYLLFKPVQQKPKVEPAKKISMNWWLLPILLSTFGGVIAYLANRHDNPKTARHQLLLGIVLVVEIPIVIFVYIYVTNLFASMFSGMP